MAIGTVVTPFLVTCQLVRTSFSFVCSGLCLPITSNVAALFRLWDEVLDDEPVRRRASPDGNEMRVARKRLRDHQDPFDAPDQYFRHIFRISKELARDLVAAVRPYLLQRSRHHGLTAKCQVSI